MKDSMNLRAILALLALSVLAAAAPAQMSTSGGKGGNPGGGGDDPILGGGGGGLHNGPPNTPEPFTIALGAGAVGLYARRRFMKSRQAS